MPEPTADSTIVHGYSRLLSLAVHEFRTPASVVNGYLRMLRMEEGLNDRQRRMIEEAEKSCGRLVGLINELSEVSKLDGGSAAFKDETFDLFAALEEVAAHMHEAPDREVGLDLTGAARGAVVHGDRQRLAAAFGALFRAILREQPAGATVVADRSLRQGAAGGAALVVVAPSGAVQHAYESAPGTFDEKRGGLGLSLPIARRVLERHGGRIWSPSPPPRAEGASERSAIVVSLPLREHMR